MVIFYLVFTMPTKWRVDLRAKIGHYRNRCLLASLMRNYFPKRPSGVPLHTLSKLCSCWFCPPPFMLCINSFAVAEGWLLLDIGWFVLFYKSADVVQLGKRNFLNQKVAGKNPLCITIFLPIMFACWHVFIQPKVHNRNDWIVTNQIEYTSLIQYFYL